MAEFDFHATNTAYKRLGKNGRAAALQVIAIALTDTKRSFIAAFEFSTQSNAAVKYWYLKSWSILILARTDIR